MTYDELLEHLAREREKAPLGGETPVTFLDANSGYVYEPVRVAFDADDNDLFVTIAEREQ